MADNYALMWVRSIKNLQPTDFQPRHPRADGLLATHCGHYARASGRRNWRLATAHIAAVTAPATAPIEVVLNGSQNSISHPTPAPAIARAISNRVNDALCLMSSIASGIRVKRPIAEKPVTKGSTTATDSGSVIRCQPEPFLVASTISEMAKLESARPQSVFRNSRMPTPYHANDRLPPKAVDLQAAAEACQIGGGADVLGRRRRPKGWTDSGASIRSSLIRCLGGQVRGSARRARGRTKTP